MRRVLINEGWSETRVAVLDEHKLSDFFIEPLDQQNQSVGDIYKGKVVDVLPGMQAAFVDIGWDKNAFLHFADVYEENDFHIEKGKELLVQVTKSALGRKGPKITTKLMIPGRYLVYIPGHSEKGISRRIKDEQERSRLEKLLASLTNADEGWIVRTEAQHRSKASLEEDLQKLRQYWEDCRSLSNSLPAPALIHHNPRLASRIIAEWFTEPETELWVDSGVLYRQIIREVEVVRPHMRAQIHLYQGVEPLFEEFNIERDIERLFFRKVWLKNGAYIVFDSTEALTAIDVNTGKFTGKKDLEETVLKTNLEAANEIARQLRLRDIGGIIIIDFIDMSNEESRRKVLDRLQKVLEPDRVRSSIVGWTGLGLLELTRQKARPGLEEMWLKTCAHCHGKGKIHSKEMMINKLAREVRAYAKGGHVEALLIEAHPEFNSRLVGTGGGVLKQLENRMGIRLYLKGNQSVAYGHYTIIATGREEEIRARSLPVKEGEIVPLLIHSVHEECQDHGISKVNGFIINVEGAGNQAGSIVLAKIVKVYRTYAKAVQIPHTSLVDK